MEFLLRPKPTTLPLLDDWTRITHESTSRNDTAKSDNRTSIRNLIIHKLNTLGIPASNLAQQYLKWTVTDEPSLDEFGDYWRVEVVSRTLSSAQNWKSEIRKDFAIIQEEWNICITTGCSMHVHVSPGVGHENRYTMDEVKQLLKGIAYWDEAITKVMPAERKATPWAYSSSNPPDLAGDRTEHQVIKKLSQGIQDFNQVPTRGWQQVFQRFDRMKMRQMVFAEFNGGSRYQSWNFAHLVDQCGTVEFRRPPGVRSAREATKWVALALGCVRASLSFDWTAKGRVQHHANVADFTKFVKSGLEALGRYIDNALEDGALREDRAPASVFSRDELRRIEKKKAEEKGKASAFVVKANSRPNTPV